MQARKHDDTSHADEGLANMSLTDIPEQLASARADAIKLHVTGSAAAAKSLTKRWYDNKRYRNAIHTLPEVITVKTPAIGDIEPVEFSVVTALKGRVSVEVTDTSLTWITQAVAYQVKSGKVKSVKSRKEQHGSSDAESDDHDDDKPSDAHPAEDSGEPPAEESVPEAQPNPSASSSHATEEPAEKRTRSEPAATQTDLRSFFKRT